MYHFSTMTLHSKDFLPNLILPKKLRIFSQTRNAFEFSNLLSLSEATFFFTY